MMQLASSCHWQILLIQYTPSYRAIFIVFKFSFIYFGCGGGTRTHEAEAIDLQSIHIAASGPHTLYKVDKELFYL